MFVVTPNGYPLNANKENIIIFDIGALKSLIQKLIYDTF